MESFMSDYFITQITASDKRGNRLVDELLTSEGIRRDGNLDYTCGMYDDEMNLIATGAVLEIRFGVWRSAMNTRARD